MDIRDLITYRSTLETALEDLKTERKKKRISFFDFKDESTELRGVIVAANRVIEYMK